MIEKRGSFFTYGETRIGQGRENAKEHLRQNPVMMQEIETRIREAAAGRHDGLLPVSVIEAEVEAV
jgi:recombination protein RecA